MSVLEKKALAFEKLAALQNEEGIDEITMMKNGKFYTALDENSGNNVISK